MCDIKKFHTIYEDVKKLSQEDTLQLVLEAKTEEEKEFYELISDFFLQKRQQECIARNVF